MLLKRYVICRRTRLKFRIRANWDAPCCGSMSGLSKPSMGFLFDDRPYAPLVNLAASYGTSRVFGLDSYCALSILK